MPIRQITAARFEIAAVWLLLCCLSSLNVATAQTPRPAGSQQPRQPATPTRIVPLETSSAPVARDIDAFCAGFIEYEPAPISLEIVGGEQEQEQHVYTDGDYVFINAGRSQGMVAGQEFSIVRPRGRFNSKWSSKGGTLGVFTQEVGRLRVSEVKEAASVAVVTGACDGILLGDVLRSLPKPLSEASLARIAEADRSPALPNRFADPSGKQQGRIVLARDGRETLSRNQVVYIDLGQEDNVKPGDLLTVYRPLGTGNIVRVDDDEITQNKHDGFESRRFRGGNFSNKAQRAQKPNGTGLSDQKNISTPSVKHRRPAMPRKIVGELVILNVEARTATAIITRVAQEVHTGDFVEVR